MRPPFLILALLPLFLSPVTAVGESSGGTLVCQGQANSDSTSDFPRLLSGKGSMCAQQWQNQGDELMDKKNANAPTVVIDINEAVLGAFRLTAPAAAGEGDDHRDNRGHNKTVFELTSPFHKVNDTESTVSLVEYRLHQSALRQRLALLRTLNERLQQAVDDGNTQLASILVDRITLVEAFISDHFLGAGARTATATGENLNPSETDSLSQLLMNTYFRDRQEVRQYRHQKKIAFKNQTTSGKQAPRSKPQKGTSGRRDCRSSVCAPSSRCGPHQNSGSNTAASMNNGGDCGGDENDDRNDDHKRLDADASQIEKASIEKTPRATPIITLTAETEFKNIQSEKLKVRKQESKKARKEVFTIMTGQEWSATREVLLPEERLYPRTTEHYEVFNIEDRIDERLADRLADRRDNFRSFWDFGPVDNSADHQLKNDCINSHLENLAHHEYSLCLNPDRVAEKLAKAASDAQEDAQEEKEKTAKKLQPLSDNELATLADEFRHWQPRALVGAGYAFRIQTQSKRVDYKSKSYRDVPVDIDIEASDQTGTAYSQGNRRQEMEDTHIVETLFITISGHKLPVKVTGVFDGHNGSDCAEFAAKNISSLLKFYLEKFNTSGLSDVGIWNALKIALVELDGMFAAHTLGRNPQADEGILSGTTANIALMIAGDLWIANLGDSRAALMGKDADNQTVTLQVSRDQKPDCPEINNGILRRGGRLSSMDAAPRIDCQLAVGRALGGKHPAVSSRPKVTKYSAQELKKWDVLIQACDSVWDVYTSARTGELISEYIEQGNSLEMAAAKVVRRAIAKRCGDNVTLMATKLGKAHL